MLRATDVCKSGLSTLSSFDDSFEALLLVGGNALSCLGRKGTPYDSADLEVV